MTRGRPVLFGTLGTLLLAAWSLVAIAAGCGGDGPTGGSSLDGLTAQQVLERTRATVATARSARFRGSGDDDGQTATIDVIMTAERSAKGTIDERGGRISFIVVGDTAYAKMNTEALTKAGGKGFEGIVGDRYLTGHRSDSRFSAIKNYIELGSTMETLLDLDGDLSRADGMDIDGTPTVQVTSSNGAIVSVADGGKPFPLRFELPRQNATVTIDWDEDTIIEAPPGAETVDIGVLPS
jgi:hypothetical protein